MKIPLLPMHVVTSRQLAAIKEQAESRGKAFSTRQIEILLNKRAMKPIRMRAKKKKAGE